MQLSNNCLLVEKIVLNKTIIDYVIEYAKQTNNNIMYYREINKVRRYKKLLLPCKLFGTARNFKIQCGINQEEKSGIGYLLKFINNKILSEKNYNTQNYFKIQMKRKSIINRLDFRKDITWGQRLSLNKIYSCIKTAETNYNNYENVKISNETISKQNMKIILLILKKKLQVYQQKYQQQDSVNI